VRKHQFLSKGFKRRSCSYQCVCVYVCMCVCVYGCVVQARCRKCVTLLRGLTRNLFPTECLSQVHHSLAYSLAYSLTVCTSMHVIYPYTGNHDTSLDTDYYIDRGHKRFHSIGKSTRTAAEISQDSVNTVRSSLSTYLQDESTVIDVSSGVDECSDDVHQFHVYGSPYSAEFCDWVS
jgi:hypothetical protein